MRENCFRAQTGHRGVEKKGNAMTFTTFVRRTLVLPVALAWLAACSGYHGSNLAPATTLQSSASMPFALAPGATSLLYVSDQPSKDVAVFTFPQGQSMGTLAVFQPAGECVSKSGNVFIANSSKSNVLVYAHGGTKPTRTITDPGYYPLGCSVDPVTGNLAVTSYTGTKNAGGLAIYARAAGKPKTFTDASIPHMSFCGYDNAGNLFFDGFTSKHAVVVGELPKGATKIASVTLDQSIGVAGGVQWDGTYLAIGDVTASAIYRFKMSAGKGTKVSTVALKGSKYVDQFWIQGTQVVAPDYISGNVRFYKYPGGGSPIKIISGFTAPIAATVSP